MSEEKEEIQKRKRRKKKPPSQTKLKALKKFLLGLIVSRELSLWLIIFI